MRIVRVLEIVPILTLIFTSIILSEGCDWSGTWSTNYGQIVLQQSGEYVDGTYTYAGGGQIRGTASENNLVGSWTQTDSRGTFEFTAGGDCNSFNGNWRNGNMGEWSGSWNGTRISVDQLEKEMDGLLAEVNKNELDIQKQIEESDRRISAAFRAGKITLSWVA
jgi:hypothetical protein